MSIQNFIPEIWDAAIMQALYESHVFAQPRVVNRTYEGVIRSQGDTVHITGIEPVSIGDYKRYQDIVFEEIDLNTRTMHIDQAKYFALAIDDIDKWQAKGDVMGPAMTEAGYKMSLAVDRYISEKMDRDIDPRNIVGVIDGTGGAGDQEERARVAGVAVRAAFVKLRTRLRRNNVPDQGWWAIVSPEVYAILLLDPQFVKADERGNASVVEGNGVVGSMYGFDIMETNNAPSRMDANGIEHHILAGNNTAFSFAEALTETDAVRFEKTFGDGIKGLHVFGGKMIRPEGLVRVDIGLEDDIDEAVSFRDAGWTEDDLKASRFPRVMNPSHTTGKTKLGVGEVDTDPTDGVSDDTGGGAGTSVSSLSVSPKTTSVASGSTRQITATATYSDGETDTTPDGITWSSSATSKATVSTSGLVTGVAAGTATITATVGGKSTTSNVTVTA